MEKMHRVRYGDRTHSPFPSSALSPTPAPPCSPAWKLQTTSFWCVMETSSHKRDWSNYGLLIVNSSSSHSPFPGVWKMEIEVPTFWSHGWFSWGSRIEMGDQEQRGISQLEITISLWRCNSHNILIHPFKLYSSIVFCSYVHKIGKYHHHQFYIFITPKTSPTPPNSRQPRIHSCLYR